MRDHEKLARKRIRTTCTFFFDECIKGIPFGLSKKNCTSVPKVCDKRNLIHTEASILFCISPGNFSEGHVLGTNGETRLRAYRQHVTRATYESSIFYWGRPNATSALNFNLGRSRALRHSAPLIRSYSNIIRRIDVARGRRREAGDFKSID